jgi:hypothetical protein
MFRYHFARFLPSVLLKYVSTLYPRTELNIRHLQSATALANSTSIQELFIRNLNQVAVIFTLYENLGSRIFTVYLYAQARGLLTLVHRRRYGPYGVY